MRAILDGLTKVYNFLKSFLCEITAGMLWALAKGLDALMLTVPALSALIVPLKAKPMCFPSSLLGPAGSKAASLLKGAVMYAYVKLMCAIKDIGEWAQSIFANVKVISDTIDMALCVAGVGSGAMINFMYNMACGNIMTAIKHLAKPAIMCRLPWAKDGAMCQTDGCIFGPHPDDTDLIQSGVRIRKLITSGSLLSNRTQ